jgi:small-conductance mechanosensitive channel
MVSLADLLTTAVLNSVFIALALFAAVVALQGFWGILLRTRVVRSVHIVETHRDGIQRRGSRLIRIVAFVTWCVGTLKFFQAFDLVIRGVSAVLVASLEVGTLHVSLGNVLALGLAVWLSFRLSDLVRFVLQEDVLPRFDLPRGVPGAVSALTGYAILLVGFLIALAAAGIEMSQFAILAGAFGVGIGFGLQNVVNNFVSGLILLFERPIQVGDLIELDQLLGTVERIGIRSSTVRTFDGAEVILPNATLIDSRVTNWTLSDQLRRFEVAVGVTYGTDPTRVLDILQTVAKSSSDVLDTPEPTILFLGFGDSSLDFSLRAWTQSDGFLAAKSRATVAVYAALNEAGIEIPFPQRDLHIRSVDDSILGSVRGRNMSDDSSS